MTRRFLIVSDLHLCDVEDHPDGWKAYKSERFVFDPAFADLVAEFSAQDGELTLVLNGDVIDFDLITAAPEDPPWPVARSERRTGLEASAAKSVWKLEFVLDQHPVFCRALVDFLAAGHRVVYILGNHDRELHFEPVRQAFLGCLRRAAKTEGEAFGDSQVTFEPWFYVEPGAIYIEHGQQYDHYTSFRNVLEPTVKMGQREVIALPMGNLSNRTLMNRMGFFNPHASDYILNLFAYAWHWLKFYAFSKHGLVFNWLWGSLVVMVRLLRLRRRQLGGHRRVRELLPPVARRYGLEVETVQGLWDLQDPPITGRLFRIVREFWIDRLLIALVMTGGTVALALVPIPLWIKLVVPLMGFPLLYFIYEWAVQGESIFTIESKFPQVARRVAGLVPVRVVTFGHTHQPRLIPLGRDVTFVDTGTWAPVNDPDNRDRLAPGRRNYLLVDFPGGAGQPCVQLRSWLPVGHVDSEPGDPTGI